MQDKDNIKDIILLLIVFIITVDVFFFLWWGISGQLPVDNFHAGIISESIVKLIIK